MPLKLELTNEATHRIWQAYDKTKEGTEYVKVPRTELGKMLRDHAQMFGALEKTGEVKETYEDKNAPN